MRPLVLLHGFTGHADCWSDVIERIPERRALPYTLLGHAWDRLDDVPASSFEAEVDRVAALIRRDCAEKACLVGYSMGGRVALVLLARHPDLFRSAVFVGASPGLESESERKVREKADATWIELAANEGVGPFMDAWQAQPMFASQLQLPVEVQLAQRRRRSRHRAEGIAAAMRTLGLAAMPNMWPELPRISVPVHLVVGELDTKFCATAETMLRAIPDGHLHVIKGAGHNVVLEKPEALSPLLANV